MLLHAVRPVAATGVEAEAHAAARGKVKMFPLVSLLLHASALSEEQKRTMVSCWISPLTDLLQLSDLLKRTQTVLHIAIGVFHIVAVTIQAISTDLQALRIVATAATIVAAVGHGATHIVSTFNKSHAATEQNPRPRSPSLSQLSSCDSHMHASAVALTSCIICLFE